MSLELHQLSMLEILDKKENSVYAQMLSLDFLAQTYQKENKKIIVFCASDIGELVVNYLREHKKIEPYCFCDNDPAKQRKIISGLETLSIDELTAKTDLNSCHFIIASIVHVTSIFQALLQRNISLMQLYDLLDLFAVNASVPSETAVSEELIRLKTIYEQQFNHPIDSIQLNLNEELIFNNYQLYKSNSEKLESVYSMLADDYSKRLFKRRVCAWGNPYISFKERRNYLLLDAQLDTNKQYFDPDIIQLESNEVFFDCGCYDSETAIKFAELSGGHYDKIISFEPDLKSFHRSVERSQKNNLEKHIILKQGLHHCSDRLRFQATGTGSARLSNDTLTTDICEIDVVSIDDVQLTLNLNTISFIKMDIEGAEKNALLGASASIRKFKPKLAISIYHKPEDIFELPILINSILPEYKLQLRQYNLGLTEFVCYATINPTIEESDKVRAVSPLA